MRISKRVMRFVEGLSREQKCELLFQAMIEREPAKAAEIIRQSLQRKAVPA